VSLTRDAVGLVLIGVTFLAFLGVLRLLVPYTEPALLVSVGICLTMFSGNWGLLGIPVPLDRLVMFYGVGLALWKWKGQSSRPQIPITWAHVAVAVMLAFAFGSALWTHNLGDSDGDFDLLDKLGFVPLLLFTLAPILFETARQRAILAWCLVATGAYLGVTAIFETTGATSFVFPGYINNPLLGQHWGRARGPFLTAASNGLILFVCLVACGMVLSRVRERRGQWAVASVAILCACGIVMTLTRQIWIGSAVGVLLTVMVDRRLRRYAVPMVIGGGALVGAIFVLIPSFSQRASARANDLAPVWDRLNSNRAALEMLHQHPLFGVGWGRFSEAMDPYYRLADTYPVTTVGEVHSVILSNVAEIGIIGTMFWAIAVLMTIGVACVRPTRPDMHIWKLGLIAVTVCWLIVSNLAPTGFAFANYMLWLWAGMVFAARATQTARSPVSLAVVSTQTLAQSGGYATARS
jgi:putative inorganic carbon (HCO3(-)) transporter